MVRHVMAGAGSRCWVALDAGSTVAVVQVDRDESKQSCFDLAVRPDLKGQGIGTSILVVFLSGSGRAYATLEGRIEPDNPASLLDKPAATTRQNRHRFSRCHTGGRPGENNFWRVDRSDFRLSVAIHTFWFGVLRRPVESAQYLSIKYTERLGAAGIEPSVGNDGDSYDNALTETIDGLFKAEVIHRRGPWRNFEAGEYATLEWVDRFNNRRLLEPIGNIPLAEAEANFYAALETEDMAPQLTQISPGKTWCG